MLHPKQSLTRERERGRKGDSRMLGGLRVGELREEGLRLGEVEGSGLRCRCT